MARTKKISDEQILEAARVVFAERGFAATTAQIATQAGISEGSIFRRWKSKDELLIDALELSFPAFHDDLERMKDSDLTVEQQFTALGNSLVEFFLQNMPKIATPRP